MLTMAECLGRRRRFEFACAAAILRVTARQALLRLGAKEEMYYEIFDGYRAVAVLGV